jgi:CO/xanthine dehydrogenase Mo-binding subunit
MESFVDELAVNAEADPLMYRLSLLAGNKRVTNLVQQLAAHARWGAPKGKNVGRGIALHPSFRSYVGLVVDIAEEDGLIRLDEITCVVDCGRVINPDTVIAQMEGGIIYGLAAAVFGEITIEGGRVVQSNFPDYPMLHMHQTPQINVHIIDSDELPGGVGEPGTPPVFPALANAYHDLKGERLRSMPMVKHGVEFV